MVIKEIDSNTLHKLNINSVFLSKEWLNLYNKEQLVLLGIYSNKTLIGVFTSYVFTRAKILKQFGVLPFMQTSLLYFNNEAQNQIKKDSFESKVLNEISNYLSVRKEHVVSFSLAPIYNNMLPFIRNNFSVTPHYTFLLDLKQSEEELLNNMSSQRRRNIKNATSDGLFVKAVKKDESFNQLIRETLKNQNVPVDYSILEKILSDFSNNEKALCLICYDKNNQPLAANYCVFDKNKAYYILGGYSKKNVHPGAGALAMWEAIKIMKAAGVNVFDFDGSMIPSIETFFRGFGGKQTTFFRLNKKPTWLKFLIK